TADGPALPICRGELRPYGHLYVHFFGGPVHYRQPGLDRSELCNDQGPVLWHPESRGPGGEQGQLRYHRHRAFGALGPYRDRDLDLFHRLGPLGYAIMKGPDLLFRAFSLGDYLRMFFMKLSLYARPRGTLDPSINWIWLPEILSIFWVLMIWDLWTW